MPKDECNFRPSDHVNTLLWSLVHHIMADNRNVIKKLASISCLTTVTLAIFSFRRNVKSWMSWVCYIHGHKTSSTSLSCQIELIKLKLGKVARFSSFTYTCMLPKKHYIVFVRQHILFNSISWNFNLTIMKIRLLLWDPCSFWWVVTDKVQHHWGELAKLD